MTFLTPWQRVYPDLPRLPESAKKRLTIELPLVDAQTILSASFNSAIFSLICQTALRDAAQFITTNSITYAESPRLIEYICKRTIGSVDQTTASHDVPGRVEGVHDGVKNVAEESAGAGTTVTSGSGGGKRKGKSANTKAKNVPR